MATIEGSYGPAPTASTTSVVMDFAAAGFTGVWQDGDILVIAVCSNDVVGNAVMRYSMAATGWEEQVDKSIDSARRQSIALYTKEITDSGSEPTSATVTASRSDAHYRACWLLRGGYSNIVVYDEDVFNTSSPTFAPTVSDGAVVCMMVQGWIQDNTNPIAPELTVLASSVPNVYGFAGHTTVSGSSLTVTTTGTELDTDDWQAVGVVLGGSAASGGTAGDGGDAASFGRGDYAMPVPMMRRGEDERKNRIGMLAQG